MLFVSPRAARFLLLEDPLPVISTAISTPTPSKAGGISSLPRSNYRTTSVPVPIIPSSALHVHERQFNSPPPFASDIPWSKEGDEKYTEAGSFLSIGNNDPPLPSPLFTIYYELWSTNDLSLSPISAFRSRSEFRPRRVAAIRQIGIYCLRGDGSLTASNESRPPPQADDHDFDEFQVGFN